MEIMKKDKILDTNCEVIKDDYCWRHYQYCLWTRSSKGPCYKQYDQCLQRLIKKNQQKTSPKDL